MAVDKKSQHVGNHGGAYTDRDGNRRQFTYIDHDPKTSISTMKGGAEAVEEFKKLKDQLVKDVLALPASMACSLNGWHEKLVNRNIEEGKIEWIKQAIEIMVNEDWYMVKGIKDCILEKMQLQGITQ